VHLNSEALLGAIEDEQLKKNPHIWNLHIRTSCPFLPNRTQMQNRVHSLLHVLYRYPFLPAVKRMFTGKYIGAGQTHE